MRPGVAPTGGMPSRSARFRRGSRGPRVTPPDLPKIGVVEVDPNFKQRPEIEPRSPDTTPAGFPSGGDERRERGGRGGRGGSGGSGGRGAGGRGDAEPGERSERGERGGRGPGRCCRR